jgi:hypothetical protein
MFFCSIVVVNAIPTHHQEDLPSLCVPEASKEKSSRNASERAKEIKLKQTARAQGEKQP